MLMRPWQAIRLGAKSLWMHRLRSTLTALGIIFGVCSVIAMLAIGEGASRQTQAEIARLGSTNIIVRTVKPPEEVKTSGGERQMTEYGLTYDDAERIRSTLAHVEVVVPVRRVTEKAQYRGRNAGVEVVGTVPWYPDIRPLRVRLGRFLSGTDLRHRNGVCVIDTVVYHTLFQFDDPIGQFVKLAGDYYEVVGVVTADAGATPGEAQLEAGDGSNGGHAGRIYTPLTTLKSRFGELKIQVSGQGGTIEKVELHQITVQVGDMSQVLPTRDALVSLLERFHEKQDYQVVVPLELLRQAARTKRIFNIVLGSIAAISLLVGGIGIMNIMLATVSERTREIGIRRALGATRRDIVVQFLVETVMLTLSGGILGIVLGSLIPLAVTRLAHLPTVITPWSLLLSFAISGAVGVTFGLYPAYRAANMDPIQSLRHE